jgi:general secretion pathway protein J
LNQKGFTLLELIITMTLLAVIIAMMTGALSMAQKTMEKGEKKMESLERRKIVFSLIESQFQSSSPSYYTVKGEKKRRFTGEKDQLTFTSNYSIWRGTQGNCLVRYYVKNTDQGKSVLYAEEKTPGAEDAKETRLSEMYESISFEYYMENALEEGKWVDAWPEEEPNMPRKFRIHFTDGAKKNTVTANAFIGTYFAKTGLKTQTDGKK